MRRDTRDSAQNRPAAGARQKHSTVEKVADDFRQRQQSRVEVPQFFPIPSSDDVNREERIQMMKKKLRMAMMYR